MRSGGGFGLQPSGRSPDAHDEPERRSFVPGNTGLSTAGQSKLLTGGLAGVPVQVVFVDDYIKGALQQFCK